jgi:PAS domain S-box-containing protein
MNGGGEAGRQADGPGQAGIDAGTPAHATALDFDLGAFLDGVMPAMVVFDQADRVALANGPALDLLARPRESVVGREVDGVFKLCLARARQRFPGGGNVTFEQFAGGRWFVVQTYELKGVRNPKAGRFWVLSLINIMERKARELETIEVIAGLEEATRIARMGTFRIDNVNGTVQWSPHMYTLHGVTPDRWRPSIPNYLDLVLAEDRDHVLREMSLTESGQGGGSFEYRIMRPDGEIRWVSLDRRVLFGADGEPFGSFGTIQDITDAKRREQTLRELLVRNAVLSQALESSPNGVVVIGMETGRPQVIYVNKAFEILTGYDAGSLAQAGFLALMAPGRDAERAALVQALGQSTGLSMDSACCRRDGSQFPAQVEIAPVREGADPLNAATSFVVDVRDLTEERKRAAALLQSQKMEALGQLSGGVAHEINNLLQPVIVLSDLGMSVLETDAAKAREYLEVIGNSGRKAREIVRQVLTFARRDTAVLSRQNVVPLVFDAINLAQKGQPPGIELRASIDATSIVADVSATQVSQVVLNLVRNASDAMAGKGVVDVSFGMVDLGATAAAKAGLSGGSWAALAVVDTGCGMDDETRRRVFEPFFTTKPVGRGTGLGLSVVYSIANAWGGAVTIDSQVDAGTRVVIYIPVKNDPPVNEGASGAENQ